LSLKPLLHERSLIGVYCDTELNLRGHV
jgi:hypothetical protein